MSLFTLLWPDVVWHVIPGIVLYQILSTCRHELAHAVAFWLAGYGIKKIYVLPHWSDGSFYWGRTVPEARAGAQQTPHIYLAPYYACALALCIWGFVVAFAAPPWVESSRMAWNLWAMFTVMFLVSPIIDFTYNLRKWLVNKCGDFKQAQEYWKTH
jgi:hypothetical protein